MNTGDLRQVAAEIRALASAATPGPWKADVLGSEGYAVTEALPFRPLRRPVRVARCGYESWDTDKGNAEHIAAWHPDVARAVAVLLDGSACEYEANVYDSAAGPRHHGDCDALIGDQVPDFGCHCFDAAFGFVTAWRGEPS